MISLPAEVLKAAFEHFRRCGEGRRECVVYLTEDLEQPELISGVIHPRHSASAAGYDLDSAAIGGIFTALAERHQTLRIQVHTHPGHAYHSARDDAMALIGTQGFLSLVIPNFGLGEVSLTDAFLAERDQSGDWRAVAVGERLAVIS